ncbi:TetR/AcrR family transcriptional regulator [Paenibacillus spiritus]|uniref:TetR/AcrR family transcriptional regulator n=1 Tax=Paenibacillus spiritus TaxID=2496557 RepID=A0A5J5G9H0_9BACL|nr:MULTISPECIES: TetR/AcrR family transcriptional regulator [Paenibacillus]KAA9004829.1 TetR/AcrR family transcriptional regulator [Paenibacillus spiritus]
MARNAEKDQALREKRLNHLLDCALEVIAVKGIGAVSISDIAAAAKISVGNVYHYFKSKDEIFDEILKRGQTAYGEFVTHTASLDLPALEKLHLICSSWLSVRNHWAHTILIHSARLAETSLPGTRSQVTERFTRNLLPVSAIIEQGQREGAVIDGDPLELAFYLVSLIQGLTLQRVPGAEVQAPIRVDGVLKLLDKRNRI